jgi:hypothetical protein
MDYFVAREVTRGKNPQIVGDYILTQGASFDGAPEGQASSTKKPNIKLPKKFEVKWILPPRTSPFYGPVKSAAEGAGYETVEHDDFSYPGPRI